MSLRLVNLNIEGDKHLNIIVPRLQALSPDILCLQEVFQVHQSLLEKAFAMTGFFAPLCIMGQPNPPNYHTLGSFGLALLTKLKVTHLDIYYYFQPKNTAEVFTTQVFANNPYCLARPVISATLSSSPNKQVNADRDEITLATTHFTWTPDGQSSPQQRHDLKNLFSYLHSLPPHLLCGDFNAPRGRQTWAKLSQNYQDNIPLSVTSTLDPHLHRHSNLNLVVDGLFSHPQYKVSNVQLVSGLSDHQAVVADISSS